MRRFAVMAMMLLIFVGPSFAKTHKDTYSMPCSALWPAVKDALRNSGYYGILGIDNTEMTASFVIGGTLGGKRINSVVLNAKGDTCEMVVQTAFSGLVHDDCGDFKTRVNQSSWHLQRPELQHGQSPPPAKPEGALNKETPENPVPAIGGAPGTAATAPPANSYEGDFPGLAYRAPQGWIAATSEKLHQGNEARLARVTAGVVQQHAGDTSLHVIAPKALFYASPSGGGDGDQISLPSVRIMALEWSAEPPSLDTVDHEAAEKAKLAVTLLHPPTEYKVAGQVFIRAEYKDESQKPPRWECHVRTVAKGNLLTLEIYTGSAEELLQAGSTVDSFSVSAP